jgi:Kef-type K+ transport system membrane component KefB
VCLESLVDHHASILLFVQLGVMLVFAVIGGQVARRFQQPAVLGELLGGILLGPTVFGTLAPGMFERVFPANASLALARDSLLRVGMLFFLFVAGLEVKLTQIRQRRAQVAGTSLLGLLVPMGLGVASVWLFPGVWGRGADVWAFSLFVGTALSISALPVIARILMDLGLIRKELGIIVMTAAALDDVVGWTLFAIILNVLVPMQAAASGSGWVVMLRNLALLVGFAAAVLALGRWLGRPALHWVKAHLAWPSGFIGLVTVLMLGAAAVTESLGIHAVFGAYLVGIAFGQTLEPGEENEAHDVIHQFAVSFFAPLYFVSIGLRANFASHFDLALVALVLVVACIGKIGGASLGAWLGGMRRREALAVGFAMNARGAMEIILASVALEAGLIDQRVFVALVVMALATSALGGPAMKRLLHGEKKVLPLAA